MDSKIDLSHLFRSFFIHRCHSSGVLILLVRYLKDLNRINLFRDFISHRIKVQTIHCENQSAVKVEAINSCNQTNQEEKRPEKIKS